jgi:hypothetical protein
MNLLINHGLLDSKYNRLPLALLLSCLLPFAVRRQPFFILPFAVRRQPFFYPAFCLLPLAVRLSLIPFLSLSPSNIAHIHFSYTARPNVLTDLC